MGGGLLIMSDELKPLNKKQKRVLDEYLICFVQWKAYKAAYPDTSDEVCRTSSSRLFADANFQAHLQARLNEAHMSADEALKLMTDIARGDIGDVIDNFGSVDMIEARKKGKTKLIKKLRQRTITKIGKNKSDPDEEIHETEVEFYPADSAIRDILKIHGKYKDTIQLPEGLRIEIVRASDATSNK